MLKRPMALLVALSLLAFPAARADASAKPAAPRNARKAPPPVATATPAPARLDASTFHSPKLRGWVNDTPDTGQFLPDSVWLVRVGPRVTRAGDFVREWFSSYPEYRPMQDSAGRVQFLNNLINRDVLALTALGQNRTAGFEDRLALRETEQRALTAAVHQRFVSDSIKVSEAEVRALWENLKWRQHLRHIVLDDKADAERVRRELISGRTSWSVAVKRYSIATKDPGPDGDLGWVTPELLSPQLQVRALSLQPGEIAAPVKDRDGWQIVQSVERRPVEPPAYEVTAVRLRSLLRAVKSDAGAGRLTAMLRAQHGVVYDSTVAAFAASRFGKTMELKQGATPTIELDTRLPTFADADTSRLLARWNGGGRYSIGDLVHTFSGIPPLLRPSLRSPEVLLAFVESVVLEPSIADFGRQRGLLNDTLVTEPMRRKLEDLMVEHLYQDSIGTRVWVSKDERKAYYQKHLAGFVTFASVQFAAIVRGSKAGVDSVEAALRSGIKAADLLRADSLAGRKSGRIQTRRQDQNGPYQTVLFEEMHPGDIRDFGPDEEGNYAIIQMLAYDPGRQLSYEESESIIAESLQNQKSDEALQAMINRLKKRYDIAWRPEKVMLVRLVDPSFGW
ncbi:MAG TPA: peptidyl-prolyl cis-trans isomerase [Candidatus Eisenbacteria bacterium]